MLKKRAVKIIVLMLIISSCAVNSAVYREIDHAVDNDDFNEAVEAIYSGQNSRKPVYSEKNAVMLYLDLGFLEYYAGNYRNSAQALQTAEMLIQDAYTRSITANFMSYIANDNTKDYPGEDFEDIYLSVFNALNYYNNGNTEGALVEIRKLSMTGGKLDMLERKYDYRDPATGAGLEELTKKETGTGELPAGIPVNFHNSALARYLAALFYLSNGNTDSARIEFNQIPQAFAANKKIYYHPVPSAIEEAQTVPADLARLNLICFSGLSPVKEEERIRYWLPGFEGTGLFEAIFKLPKLVPRPGRINRIEVAVAPANLPAPGQNQLQKFDLELLEDMGAVIQETFTARYNSIVTKTYIRTLIKYASSAAAGVAVGRQTDELFGFLAGLIFKIGMDATESADIRMSRYLPDKAYIGGINLDPGLYDVTVNYYANSQIISRDHHSNVEVGTRGINLVNSVCLK